MASPKTPELNDAADGLPRRRAIQGLAGGLAGIAALSAMNASAKNKKRKKVGKLSRFETASVTQSIPTATPTLVSVECPAAGKKEQVYATGGGYQTTQAAVTMFAFTSQATNDLQGWEVEFINAGAVQDATVSVVCGYFKKK
jgi:hypothetical protein